MEKKFRMYQELNEEDTDIKQMESGTYSKAILLFPPIAFALIF